MNMGCVVIVQLVMATQITPKASALTSIHIRTALVVRLPPRGVRAQAHNIECLSVKQLFSAPPNIKTTKEGLQDGSIQLVTTATMSTIASKVSFTHFA